MIGKILFRTIGRLRKPTGFSSFRGAPLRPWLAAALLLFGALPGGMPAMAETPKDALVMALQIDDIITLDPAEVFEFSGAEYIANVYDRLVAYEPPDFNEVTGGVAERWEIGDDGRTYTFYVRDGLAFHSGNPVTAFDAAYSLQRVVRLGLSPAFILTQFGFTPENVAQRIRALDERRLVLETDKPYAPSLVLNCLTAGIGSVVDSKRLREHEENGDMGHAWLRTHSAGSGPFALKDWRPNEILILESFPDYWRGAPAMTRVIIRHIAEPATQRLLLEKGDIDIARNLGSEQLEGLADDPAIRLMSATKGTLYYLGLNQKNPYLARPEVRQALKYLVDYDGIAATILENRGFVHQAFVPQGYFGALDDNPFRLDVAKAKALLAEAGLADGFPVAMDTRNVPPVTDIAQALQASFGEAGIRLEIVPGDGKQTLTKYRARNHDIYIGIWGSDYRDPHSNADSFSRNPDNSDDAPVKSLAWRNAWDIPELTAKAEAAMMERDTGKRARLYEELQRIHQQESPFVIMFQAVEVSALRARVSGFVSGPSFDTVYYRDVVK